MAHEPSPPPQPGGELLKSAEVARLLRVHPKQIYRLLAQGLPGLRVGSEWRFLRDEVLAWSERRESGATAQALGSPVVTSAPAPPPLLAANGDVVVEILLDCLARQHAHLVGFVQADRGAAFEHLAAGAVLFAGFHGEPPPSHVATVRLARVHLVERDVGLAHPATVRLRSVTDLARKRLAAREPSAGVRAHLDRALLEAGTRLTTLRTRVAVYESHRDAACALVRGEVDAALTTAAWAERVGMTFLRLATESYDLVLRAENLGRPECVAVCEVAQSLAFRQALGRVAGYDPATSGAIRYDGAAP
ncbi:MAG: helix-turn-helix transcriptional regulator [Polyangiaceae bacterium]|nr:helix-turn-helix transcriptional regulator [Polyangiaceae bacterium]